MKENATVDEEVDMLVSSRDQKKRPKKVDNSTSPKLRISCHGVISHRQSWVEVSLQNCFPQGSPPLLSVP